MHTLTKKQKAIYDYIKIYTERHGYAPTFEEIKKHFKLKALSGVYQHVDALIKKEFLIKHDNSRRGIETKNIFQDFIKIPLLGTIAAGQPIEAIEEKETIAVPKINLPKTSDLFALRVSGDSMIEENINNGDIVIIKNQSTADNGQKVVALIDNSEVTLKKIYKEKGRIRLQPANVRMNPIYVKPENLMIQGVVIDIIKSTSEEKNKEQINLIKNITPEHRRPRGGCELYYPNKEKEEVIIYNTEPAKLKLEKKHGTSNINKLISGDNLNILKTLYENDGIRGKVNLIYIDPPFGTGQDFIGYDKDIFYSDKLINTEFLEFIRKRLIFLRELLADDGSIYLHIDQKIGHYIKILMDEIFGEENFRNDITRLKCNPKNFERKAFGNIKDVIYFYSKTKPNGSDPINWTDYRMPLTDEEITRQFPKIDQFGRRYATTPLHAKGETINGPTGKPWKGLNPPKGRHWRYNPEELTKLDKQGLVEWSSTGNPRKIIYADETRGKKIQDVWDFKDPGLEKSLYPTEKNEAMLKQIILASSKENNIVLDCFAGSGTTIITAEKLNRNWIGIDLNNNAINIIEKRLSLLDKKTDLFNKPISYSVYSSY